jgi:hypothetical protein
MRVHNPDCSPVGIHCCDTAPTPTGFAEVVSDNLPALHALDCVSFALHGNHKNDMNGPLLKSKGFRFLNAE